MLENTDKIQEEDAGFKEWYENLQKMDPEERSNVLLDKAKEQVSDVDKQVLDDIVSLLNNNKDKHTDLLWLNDELEKKYPDINPLATLSYFLLLNTCGIVNLDDK